MFRKTRKRGRFLAENDPQGVLPQGKGWCLTRDLGQVSNYRNRTFGAFVASVLNDPVRFLNGN
jgi:hypothetical protein